MKRGSSPPQALTIIHRAGKRFGEGFRAGDTKNLIARENFLMMFAEAGFTLRLPSQRQRREEKASEKLLKALKNAAVEDYL
jgi:hypothetical protein